MSIDIKDTRFGVLNVKSNPLMPTADAVSDINRFSGRVGVGGFSEIQPEDYKQAVAALEMRGFCVDHLDTECPIFWRDKAWDEHPFSRCELRTLERLASLEPGALRGEKLLGHTGRALTSPHRWATMKRLTHPRSGQTVVFIATHMVSGAWCRHPHLNKRWRQRMWVRHHERLSALIGALRSMGFSVILAGDMNRLVRTTPEWHPRQRVLVAKGLDHMIFIPARRGPWLEVNATEVLVGEFHTDHPGLIVHGNLVPTKDAP